MTERPSAPAASTALAISATLTGAIFYEQRLIGHLAAGSHNGRGALGRGAHGGTAGSNIGAAHVDLVAGSPGAQLDIHLERADKLLDGMTGNLADDLATVLEAARATDRTHGQGGHAGALKAHGVDHAARSISAIRGAGLPGQGPAAQPLVVMAPSWETSKKFWNSPAVAKGTGCGVDGVLHLDAAEIDGHVHGTH